MSPFSFTSEISCCGVFHWWRSCGSVCLTSKIKNAIIPNQKIVNRRGFCLASWTKYEASITIYHHHKPAWAITSEASLTITDYQPLVFCARSLEPGLPWLDSQRFRLFPEQQRMMLILKVGFPRADLAGVIIWGQKNVGICCVWWIFKG